MARGEKYRFIDHTADLGMEAYGEDRTQLFTNAAEGFYRLILKEDCVPEGEEWRDIEVHGGDEAELLKEFLSELNYLLVTDQYVGWFFENPQLSDNTFAVSLRGRTYEGLSPAEFEIKAVTYHGLQIERDPAGWKARVIFDV